MPQVVGFGPNDTYFAAGSTATESTSARRFPRITRMRAAVAQETPATYRSGGLRLYRTRSVVQIWLLSTLMFLLAE